MKGFMFFLLLLAPLALAGGDHYQPKPKGGGNEQNQHQSQSNYNGANSKSYSGSNSTSKAISGAASKSGAVSNSGGNHLSTTGGKSKARSSAVAGDSSAAIGNVGGGSTGPVELSGGDTNVSNINSHDYAVASAASVFAGQCQSGLSGSFEDGGFSVVSSRQFCDVIEAMNISWQMYQREVLLNPCKSTDKPACIGVCTKKIASVTYNPPVGCDYGPRADSFLEDYYENYDQMIALVQSTEVTGKIDRVSSSLFKPFAAILALIWIL